MISYMIWHMCLLHIIRIVTCHLVTAYYPRASTAPLDSFT